MISENQSTEALVTLVGGPCDGQRTHSLGQRIHVPLHNGEWARFGDNIDDVAVYELDITGLRAHYVKRSQA
jgi:hypothetical protein